MNCVNPACRSPLEKLVWTSDHPAFPARVHVHCINPECPLYKQTLDEKTYAVVAKCYLEQMKGKACK